MHYIERTCTKISVSEHEDQEHVQPNPLSASRNLSAYVLLGDPGAGKTTAFEHEANQEKSFYITARDLITFDKRSEWQGKTLYIDGLDEIRAGSLDARTSFDAIRAQLDRLGHPRFRLSCREADWFGSGDQEGLKSVSPNGQVSILHLDPLTEANIVDILSHNPRVQNAEKFIQWAKQKGLSDLLTNPQILDMLTKAVNGDNWPKTRKQTFEMACQTIVREHNREHLDSKRTSPPDETQLISASGFLCAAQLIAGNAGYSLSSDMENPEYPRLDNLDFDNFRLLGEAVRTKLFKAPSEERITPVHRHVAEYLAARYLAEQVEHKGLPIGRIMALIIGEDGVVVGELRGLSAWLAALCKSHRSTIIDRDPLGVVLYGDVQDFSHQEKLRVLDGLQREATRYPWFRSVNWTTSPFGALATPDMEAEFRTILTSSDRDETHQALTHCVLDAMSHGSKLNHLDKTLLGIIRDPTWFPRIRLTALKVLQQNSREDSGSKKSLNLLLDEISTGMVDDLDDSLLGSLLTELYPSTVSAREVLNYLHTPKRPNYFGSYLSFWDRQLLNQSSDSDVSTLLDGLISKMSTMQQILETHHMRDLTAKLLARGLEKFGESIESMQIYEWLGVGLDKYGRPHSGANKCFDSIRKWLELHPLIQKSIIEIGLNHCAGKENFRYCMFKVQSRLFHANPPDDYGQWCLEQMQLASSDDISFYLLQEAVETIGYKRGNANISLETIETISEQNLKYKGWLKGMLVRDVIPEEREYIVEQQLRKAKEHKKKQEWLDYAKSHEIVLREGRAQPHLLNDLATAYFGNFVESEGDTPIERLQNFLNHNGNLVIATLEALRNSCKRDDIPSVKDIIRLKTEGQIFLLSRPFMAGLAELTRESPKLIDQLTDDQVRQATAFYLVDGTGEEPDWYISFLENRHELVAEVLFEYVVAALRNKESHISGLYALAYDDAYESVARAVSLSLLNAFPVRSTNQQLNSLDELLKTALRYEDSKAFLKTIEKKLNLRSMNVAQRIRWLSVGLIVDPDIYLESIAEFVGTQEKRVQHLAGFFSDRHDQWFPQDDLSIPTLGFLIRLIGGFFAPYSLEGGGWVSPAMNAADFVSRLIKCLGSQPEKEATVLLEDLSKTQKLIRWHYSLTQALFEQRATRREANFQHPDIHQIIETLNNRSPANSGDLAALITEILHELAYRIRNGNTDDYRQFWNEGPQRQLTSPKHEDACRDALLSDLQQRLIPLGIDAQPEGHYADNKRADIRVAYGGSDGFEVPIEIKKNTHPKLWYAIHNQLIEKYTRDPHAHGYGIYLVVWFGVDATQPPPKGSRPRTAEELKERLCATLTADESRKISVCVIDVSEPSEKAKWERNQ